MQPSLLKSTVTNLIGARRPVMIEGSPGLGKTQIVQQIARERSLGFVQLHAPLMQPEDYGMPIVNANRDGVTFAVPDKFPMEGSSHPDQGVLLIDELPQADNAGQKILANLIQERELHGRKLKPGWSIVATGNRQQDRAGANRILSHLRNRVTTLEFEAHLDDWCDWALNDGVDPTVVGFVRFKPALLSAPDNKQEIYPTPRAWVEGVSNIIGKVDAKAEYECFRGAVGEGAASEFTAFLRIYRDLPDPDRVIENPDRAAVPTKMDVQYALAGALAHRATPDNFGNIIRFAERMPPEFMVLIVRDAAKRNPHVTATKAFLDWSQGAGRILAKA